MPLVARSETGSEKLTSKLTGWLLVGSAWPLDLLIVAVGLVASSLTVSVSEFELPALSSTEHSIAWLPSPAIAPVQVPAAPALRPTARPPSVQAGLAARPAPESEALSATVAGLVLFQ